MHSFTVYKGHMFTHVADECLWAHTACCMTCVFLDSGNKLEMRKDWPLLSGCFQSSLLKSLHIPVTRMLLKSINVPPPRSCYPKLCVVLYNKGPASQGYGFSCGPCIDVRVGLWRKLNTEELMLSNCGVGEDSWESLGLQGLAKDQTRAPWSRNLKS